jgi:DNA polymerase-4
VKTVIFHIDVNSAYLSWEAVYRLRHLEGTLDLRTIPAAVGGDMAKRRGIILAKSIPAKAYGVKTGEPVVDAKKKCPNLKLVPPHYDLYHKSSKAFLNILKEYSPAVEQYSIDEAFMDMTGMEDLLGDLVVFAHTLKNRIRDELGFTVNIGVSGNKLLAKMASDFKKPDLVHTLFPEEIDRKMWPLPVREMFSIGRATERKLNTLGIHTIGELANTDPEVLKHHLKKYGELIWNFANGRDMSVVEAVPEDNKGYGNSTTIAFDVTDEGTAKMILLSLAETVSARLRQDGIRAELVSVAIKDFELNTESHQMLLPAATNITAEIHQAACRLFDELWDGTPIRHLGIHTGRLSREDSGRQLSLFDQTDYQKLEKIDQAVDEIRKKFGADAVMRASFLKQPVEHMAGGISKEKRKVDYSKERIE